MNNKKNILKGILVIIVYFFLEYNSYLPLKLLDINELSFNNRIIYSFIYNIFICSIIIIILYKDFINDFKDFKKNYSNLINKYFKYWFLLFGLMVISNLIIQKIYPGSIAANEQNIQENLSKIPIYTIISACIFAPIIEELVFRMSIKKIFNNKYIFIIVSGLIFGSLHVINSLTNILDLLYLIPYCIPGFILAYVYYHSNNIFTSIFIHFIHNTFLVLVSLL